MHKWSRLGKKTGPPSVRRVAPFPLGWYPAFTGCRVSWSHLSCYLRVQECDGVVHEVALTVAALACPLHRTTRSNES